MTRYHYFELQHPDGDDLELQRAIADGRVPSTCLAGGQLLLRLEGHPCETCPATDEVRKRCGGSKSDYKFPSASPGEAALWAARAHQAALRAERDTHREQLDAMFEEGEE